MSVPRLQLKHPTGLFAAYREFAQALNLLSEGSMLKTGLDRQPLPELVPIPFPVEHDNLHVPGYYYTHEPPDRQQLRRLAVD